MRNQDIEEACEKFTRNLFSVIADGFADILACERKLEREDKPIKGKRQLIYEIYPLLEEMSDGYIYNILSARKEDK